jgi:hypothetical protein
VQLLEPVDRVQVALLGAVVHDDEEIQVGVIVEAPEVDSDRAEPEQRQGVTALRENDAQVVEPLQDALRDAAVACVPCHGTDLSRVDRREHRPDDLATESR